MNLKSTTQALLEEYSSIQSVFSQLLHTITYNSASLKYQEKPLDHLMHQMLDILSKRKS